MSEKYTSVILSNICVIEDDNGNILVQDRKRKDWPGITFPGGHVEEKETLEESVIREVKEETGLTLTNYKFRGIVTFVYGEDVVEYMHLYTADKFEGELLDCDEGELVWEPIKEVCNLPIWEGDKIFFRLLEEDGEFFSLKLVYNTNDELIKTELH